MWLFCSRRSNDLINKIHEWGLKLILNDHVSNFDTLPVDTGSKLNVHKTFRRRPVCLLNVLCAFNLRPVSIGLLQNNNDTCNHHRNIQTWIVEICEIKNRLNPSIMDLLSERRNSAYNLRNLKVCDEETKNGLQILNCRPPRLWSAFPISAVDISTLWFNLKKVLGNENILTV